MNRNSHLNYNLLLFLLLSLGYSQNYREVIPAGCQSGVIHYTAMSLCYAEEHEQARWVVYQVGGHAPAVTGRTDDFRPDPKIATGSATLNDYRGSGYDRGHLAPAAVFKHSAKAMSESFLLSNMSPQLPAFNRGGWKHLETLIRNFSDVNGPLVVVTGPVFNAGELPISRISPISHIGGEEVSVPSAYFKAVLKPAPGARAIAFLMPHTKIDKALKYYVVSVDSVEAITGLDLFESLADSVEVRVEAMKDFASWGVEKPVQRNVYSGGKVSSAVQCKGTTKKGRRCKIRTRNQSGLCWRHE